MRPLSAGVRVSSCATAAAAFGGVFALGVIFGFRSLRAHVLFVILSSSAIAAAWPVATWFEDDEWVTRAVRTAIVCFASIVLSGLVLGAVGLLTISAMLTWQIVQLAIAWFWPTEHRTFARSDHGWQTTFVIGIGVAIVAFVIGMGAGHSPLTAYDSLSYHLFFPARWLHDHRIFIVPTPFSDEAQAYQPGNGELFFAWLMLPFHGDLLARIGQIPFYLLGAGVLYMLARRLGATPDHAIYPSVFFLAAPRIAEEATGANVDLICAVMLVAALAFGITAVDRDRRRDWLFWGITLGLFVGSKYLALVYAPLFLALPFIRGTRPRALWAIPGVLVLGAPWYLRNWIAAGSPIYPSSLALAGVTIARGAFSHAALTHSAFHSTDVAVLGLSMFHAFGITLLTVWVPAAIAAIFVTIRSRRWWPAGFVLVATALMVPLCWLGVPDNADSRFLLPAVVVAMIVFALAFTERHQWNRIVAALYIVGLAFVLAGARGELQFSRAPWFMDEWFKWEGVIKPAYLAYFAGAALAAAAIGWILARTEWRIPALTTCALLGAVVLADGAERWCPSRCDFVAVAPTHIRIGETFGWWWLEEHVSGANVAYTGDNLPYGLAGHHLQNTVYYVNIDRHVDWRFDHYARAYQHRGVEGDVRLASASNVLDPLDAGSSRIDAPRPRFERMSGDRAAWIRNLQKLRINYLCVFALNPYEIKYVWHNDAGFPIEDDWAQADTHAFQLVFDNRSARIYAVDVQ
jgi:hypothetical protein